MSDTEFYVASRQRDLVNGLAVALPQFDVDLARGRADKAQLVRRFRFISTPVQLRSEPAGKEKRSRSKPRCEIDAQLIDFGEAMMRRRMIEELGKGQADFVEPRPV